MRYELIDKRWIIRIQDNGALSLHDRQKNIAWGGEVPGWVSMCNNKLYTIGAPEKVGRLSDNCAYAIYKTPHYSFRADFEISDECLSISLTELLCDGELEYIEYPAHMFRVDSGVPDGYIVIPHKQGTLIPSRLDDGFMRYRHNTWRNIADVNQVIPFEFSGLNMTWFGACKGDAAVMCYLPEASDMALHINGNAVFDENGCAVNSRQGNLPGTRYSSLTPVWRGSRGKLDYKRTINIMLIDGGYVGMTKQYRDLVKASGRFVSLKDKIEKNPNIEGMIGAPDIKIYIYTNRRNEPRLRSWSEPILDGYECVHTTFDQVGEIIDDMRNLSIKKALVLLGGWNRAGYDREHIDMWPPAEGAGGVEGLAKVSKKAIDEGYVFSLHDNYQDIYPDSPSYDEKFVMKHTDGTIMLGGIWDGGLCRLVCSSQAMSLADPIINKIKENSSVNSYYLDTTTSAPLYECYDENHPLCRKDDRANKLALLQKLDDQGWVVGAEAGVDWAVPVCAFFEGMPGTAIGLNHGAESAGFGMMVPLFNLVYHDAVVCYWQHGQPFGREDHVNHVLHDLLSAQPSSWSLIYEQWEDLKPLIKQCYDLLAKMHEKTAFSEMTDHLISDDYLVHTSKFSNGTVIHVNFDIRTRTLGDIQLKPKGFYVQNPDESPISGSLPRDIVIQ
jgi:hypothetical protein